MRRLLALLFRRRTGIAPMMGGSLAGRLLHVNHLSAVNYAVARVPRHRGGKVWR